ncbi:CPBP family intramembrane glutamic endopeptidase [Nesterenkonia muleiensis]|uniref:CPBP family intramembrane glutamic endopeptidase n=1 Tax=Nesterenkonia muleiensis TaxID=2282648 RepID=UPI000E758E14|nr:CPBP family intramembrane glutamic endopeptidase [Nesterenkonia muleiensis]
MESQNSGAVATDDNTRRVDLFASERVRRITPVVEENVPSAVRRARGTRTWLEGSATARAWNGTVLAYAAFAVGTAIVLSVTARTYLAAPVGPVVSSLVLWTGMAVPVVIAIARSRPRGLFRFRWTDLLWGLALGLLLRMVQGWLEVAAGSAGGLPAYSTIDGTLGATWLLLGLLGPVLILPLVEEFLFRGVVLVTIYRTARRGLEAGILAVAASTATFVGIHAVNGMSRWDEPVYLFLLGMTCGFLVLFTGRIWGAVFVHMVFNGMWVALALVGTALG